jgi:PAS domain-containing protein
MALSEDITQRKRAEEALQRSEGYLAEAQKLTHTGSWAAQVSQKENVHWSNVYWSKEMYRIFGSWPSHCGVGPQTMATSFPVVIVCLGPFTELLQSGRRRLPAGA